MRTSAFKKSYYAVRAQYVSKSCPLRFEWLEGATVASNSHPFNNRREDVPLFEGHNIKVLLHLHHE